MKNIKLTKKDINQITEACIRTVLKEKYFDRYQYQQSVMTYLERLCRKIDNDNNPEHYYVSSDYDGDFTIDEHNIKIDLTFDVNTGKIYVRNIDVANVFDNPDEAINTFNWGIKILTALKQTPYKIS